MTDAQGTPPEQSAASGNASGTAPDWYTKPPEWYTKPPTAQSTGNSSGNDSGNSGQQGRGYGGDILTALNALPEKLVNAMRESTPEQKPSDTNDKEAEDKGKSGDAGSNANNPGPGNVNLSRQERFARWWGG